MRMVKTHPLGRWRAQCFCADFRCLYGTENQRTCSPWQVEHPVTEWISNVNIPSCQLLIGMGVPLHRIPDIRRLYGRDTNMATPIDFDEDPQIEPSGPHSLHPNLLNMTLCRRSKQGSWCEEGSGYWLVTEPPRNTIVEYL